MGGDVEQSFKLVEYVVQIEVEDFQVEFTCLDFGKVQNVIDEVEENFTAGVGHLGIFALLVAERAV